MFKTICLLCLGASLGALSRYGLSVALNSVFSFIALGTLAVNLLGGYFIGFLLGFFEFFPQLDKAWSIFFITGFLGSFTTFSAFSAEAVLLFQDQRILAALFVIFIHVIGSLLCTFLGFFTSYFMKNIFI